MSDDFWIKKYEGYSTFPFWQTLVRVHPERVNTKLWREEALADIEHAKQMRIRAHLPPAPTETDEQIVASMLDHAAKRGYKPGDIAKVVMLSRFGDCGVTKRLNMDSGYDLRLYSECMELLTAEESARAMAEWSSGALYPDVSRGELPIALPTGPGFVFIPSDDPPKRKGR